MSSLDELDDEQHESTWRILVDSTPALSGSNVRLEIAIADLLSPPIHEKLAMAFVRMNRDQRRHVFLTPEQLFDIANEPMTPRRVKWETNLATTPAVYTFVSIVQQQVLKVGQAGNLRERIANGHLRYGFAGPSSNLIAYCNANKDCWPQCLVEEEITMLAFPMVGSCEEERRFIELGLQKLLHPLMP